MKSVHRRKFPFKEGPQARQHDRQISRFQAHFWAVWIPFRRACLGSTRFRQRFFCTRPMGHFIFSIISLQIKQFKNSAISIYCFVSVLFHALYFIQSPKKISMNSENKGLLLIVIYFTSNYMYISLFYAPPWGTHFYVVRKIKFRELYSFSTAGIICTGCRETILLVRQPCICHSQQRLLPSR